LTPDDIAEIVVFIAGRRENVVVADTLVFPNHQVGYQEYAAGTRRLTGSRHLLQFYTESRSRRKAGLWQSWTRRVVPVDNPISNVYDLLSRHLDTITKFPGSMNSSARKIGKEILS
jgi:hypothetical protein